MTIRCTRAWPGATSRATPAPIVRSIRTKWGTRLRGSIPARIGGCATDLERGAASAGGLGPAQAAPRPQPEQGYEQRGKPERKRQLVCIARDQVAPRLE